VSRIITAVLTACCLALVGCGSKVEEQADERPAATSAAPKQTYQLGETATIAGFSQTVLSVRKYTSKEVRAGDGHMLVLIEVTLEDAGSEDFYYNTSDYLMELADGFKVNGMMNPDPGALPDSGHIAPGESVSGSLLFDVPKDLHGLNLFNRASWAKPGLKVSIG
jgi:hypothetical protein